MARLARVVIPNFPHHVVQRGNRRQAVFFQDSDYREYLTQLSVWCRHHQVKVWAYCLMTNHVHLILVPETRDELRRAIGEAHRRYSRMVNFRKDWRGYLFQGRFSSYPLGPGHLLAATRYVERNPVDAGLVSRPEEYPWSSAAAHIHGSNNSFLDPFPLLDEIPDWGRFLICPLAAHEATLLETHERTGRPLGDRDFIAELERREGRPLTPRKPGRKPGTAR